jgi:hypothetical protein
MKPADSYQKYQPAIGRSPNDSDNSGNSVNSENAGRNSRVFEKTIVKNSDMFRDYRNAVVNKYREQVASKTIALNLFRLTPAKVKKECEAVCKARFQTADERTLRAFFGNAENCEGYLRTIDRVDIDRFKPLINFLEGKSRETDEKNIELLAWLIDFEDRPFDLYGKYGKMNSPFGVGDPIVESTDDTSKRESKRLGTTEAGIPPQETSKEGSGSMGEKPNRRKKRLVAALIIALSAASYFAINNFVGDNNRSNADSCMYWKDDHFEKVSCRQKIQNANVIALDADLLNNFKKITMPDTITYTSIGKIWYTKIKGQLEYYTGMGYHPISTQLQLKPITKYIIDTHIRNKTLPKDSLLLPFKVDDTSKTHSDNFKASATTEKTSRFGVYGQCQQITKAKTRCLRSANKGGYCWQHSKKNS